MDTIRNADTPSASRIPWNKGKLVGPKPPLQPKHVWAIRTHLQVMRKVRDLALFNLAIDSKLRGCDVVSLKVEDVALHGYTIERATVRQKNLCAAGDTESNAGRVRLLGYRVGAPNAGLPAGKNAYCQTRFLRCKKSRRVACGSVEKPGIPPAPSRLLDQKPVLAGRAKLIQFPDPAQPFVTAARSTLYDVRF